MPKAGSDSPEHQAQPGCARGAEPGQPLQGLPARPQRPGREAPAHQHGWDLPGIVTGMLCPESQSWAHGLLTSRCQLAWAAPTPSQDPGNTQLLQHSTSVKLPRSQNTHPRQRSNQAGWGSEQPAPAERVPAPGSKVPSTQSMLWNDHSSPSPIAKLGPSSPQVSEGWSQPGWGARSSGTQRKGKQREGGE